MSDDRRLERIEAKLDDLVERQGEMNVTLEKQHQSLRDHMRRTQLLENEIKPVKKHVAMVEGALKLVGLISLLVGIYLGVRSI